MKTITRLRFVGAAAFALLSATPALAADFIFDFTATPTGFGTPGSGSGTLTTDGITFDSRGFTAQTITGITGTYNGSAITNLASVFGSNNLFYVTGPSFVDGSGLGFVTAAGTSVNLFFQDSASSFRVNTISPFTSNFATASASAVSAVPEPATWAMMLIGFGGIGYSMRRRNVGFKALQAV